MVLVKGRDMGCGALSIKKTRSILLCFRQSSVVRGNKQEVVQDPYVESLDDCGGMVMPSGHTTDMSVEAKINQERLECLESNEQELILFIVSSDWDTYDRSHKLLLI